MRHILKSPRQVRHFAKPRPTNRKLIPAPILVHSLILPRPRQTLRCVDCGCWARGTDRLCARSSRRTVLCASETRTDRGHLMRKIVSAGVGLLALAVATPAAAADLARRAPVYKAPPPVIDPWTWTGVYV